MYIYIYNRNDSDTQTTSPSTFPIAKWALVRRCGGWDTEEEYEDSAGRVGKAKDGPTWGRQPDGTRGRRQPGHVGYGGPADDRGCVGLPAAWKAPTRGEKARVHNATEPAPRAPAHLPGKPAGPPRGPQRPWSITTFPSSTFLGTCMLRPHLRLSSALTELPTHNYGRHGGPATCFFRLLGW